MELQKVSLQTTATSSPVVVIASPLTNSTREIVNTVGEGVTGCSWETFEKALKEDSGSGYNDKNSQKSLPKIELKLCTNRTVCNSINSMYYTCTNLADPGGAV